GAAQSVLRLGPFDRDACQMSELLDLASLLRRGAARFVRIDRESAQYPSVRGRDRGGPARAQPVRQSQFPIGRRPALVRSNVGRDHSLVEMRGGAAGTEPQGDRTAVDLRHVAPWKAGSSAVTEARTNVIQQQDGNK